MAKYNRDIPLPSSNDLFGDNNTKGKSNNKNTKTVGVMTASEAQARKDAYEGQTGKKYVPKSANTTAAAPRKFASEAAKKAWFAKNAPERMTKKK